MRRYIPEASSLIKSPKLITFNRDLPAIMSISSFFGIKRDRDKFKRSSYRASKYR